MSKHKPSDGCPKCGASAHSIADARTLESLQAFAESIVRGEYGPGLMEARTMIQQHAGVIGFIGELDAELRNRAKVALSGGRYVHPPKHFAKAEGRQ